jgi:hypothetical protein
MAKTFNLESCDEFSFPTLPSSIDADYTTYEGQYVSFEPSAIKRYYVTKNHQAFIPYNYDINTNEQVTLTVTSLVVDGDQKLVSPNVFTWVFGDIVTAGLLGASPMTFNYPANYNLNYHRSIAKYTGTTYQVNFVNAINTLFLAHSTESIVFYRLDTNRFFAGIGIEKSDQTSFTLTYSITRLNTITSSSITDTYEIVFGSSSISYKVNGLETAVSGPNLAQAFLTDQKALRVYDYNLGDITPQEDCLCEECQDCFMLKNCKTGELKLTCSDLQSYVGRIIKIDTTENCWEVLETPDKELVTVVADYGKCKQCLPKCITNDCK